MCGGWPQIIRERIGRGRLKPMGEGEKEQRFRWGGRGGGRYRGYLFMGIRGAIAPLHPSPHSYRV